MTSKGTWRNSEYKLVLLATALISYSVLTFEIVLTRIFSVMLSYHYVFAVISFAMFGLGIGGMLLQKWSRWFRKTSYHTNSTFFTLMIAVSVISIIKMPIYDNEAVAKFGFWIYIFVATLPFFFAGLTLAGIFQDFAEHSSVVYSADLLGATLGTMSVVPLLNGFGGVNAALLTAVTAAVAAVLLVLARQRVLSVGSISIIGLSLGLITLGWFGLDGEVPILKNPDKDMYRMLSNPLDRAEIVESRWSAFGRTDIVRSALPPDDMTIFVDGSAGSPMYNLQSIMTDSTQKAHLMTSFGAYFPFYFLTKEEKNNALIIGSGGGRDVVIALLGGVEDITAVEVNPDVVQIVKDYEKFNGGIYTDHPRVTAILAEGRNYIRSTDKKFDLIMLAVPVTKSSRSIEGYALTESYMFTVESMQDYLNRLTPEGRIVIVAHSGPEIYRSVILALTAFKQRNISHSNSMKHMYMMASGRFPTLIIQNSPFEPGEIEKRYRMLQQLGFDKLFYIPYAQKIMLELDNQKSPATKARKLDQVLQGLASGKLSLSQLLRGSQFDISAVTDDSPFFYKFERGLPQPFGLFKLLIILAIGSLIGLLLIPKAQKKSLSKQKSFIGKLAFHPRLKIFLIIFFSLGMAFMLIEIALFQKLTLFLGQPVLALTVLLFSLLLGSGLGSLTSSLITIRMGQAIAFSALAVFTLTMIYAFYLTDIFNLGLNSKLVATVLLLPLGFAMGFSFPLSIRLMNESGFGDSIYLMWGVNGIASVLGSALTMIIGILRGFSYAMFLGSILYLVVAGLGLVLLRQNQTT